MTLARRLAEHVLERHPDRATTALERLGEGETVELLGRTSIESAAAILRRLSPQYAKAVLRGVEPPRAALILDALPNDVAVRVVRRLEAQTREAILVHLPSGIAAHVRSVLRFPDNSAGGLMDPEVLALPQELTAREALQRVRKTPEFARYNVYVVDQAQRLVGALNLRELLIARSRVPLSDVMVRDPHRVRASDDRAAVMAHPGWREVHALPVVDAAGVYLGAIRYRTLREIENELLKPPDQDLDSAAAFAQLISAGARGVLDALSGAAEPVRQGGKRDA